MNDLQSKAKRVAIVARGAAMGGSGRVSAMLSNFLAFRGYHVHYYALVYPGQDYELDSGIEYTYLNKSKSHIINSIKVYKALKEYSPDQVISFMTNPVFLSSILLNVPFVYSLRNDPNSVDNDMVRRHIRNFEYARAKKIVFQTSGARDYFNETIKNKGEIIGNPLRENLPYWSDAKHEDSIISTCRLESQKNLPMLLKAFAMFNKMYPNYDLKICGEGALKNKLAHMCTELGIENSVKFLGFRKDVDDIVAHSAIFVLSSDYEGISNSMLEALAIGIPTICTDCPSGGAAQYITNKKNGMLVPVGDVDSLYNTLCELVENKELCKVISKEAVKIRQSLSPEVILSSWESIL